MLRPAAVRIVVVALLAVFVAVGRAPVASATFPGANGKLVLHYAFLSTLKTLNLNGSAEHSFASNGEEPAWSPDGGRIVFRRVETLWVVDSDGTDAHSLGVKGYAPSWSPDGTKIVFSANGQSIDVINADGTGLNHLTADLDGNPAWSPDGSKIVFNRYQPVTGGYMPALWIMDADGENETLLYDNGGTGGGTVQPKWSPDGTKIVFTTPSFGQVYVIDSEGSNPIQLTSDGYNWDGIFSPDGTKVAFTSTRGEGVWTMNPDGTNQVRRNQVAGADLDWQPLHVALTVSKLRARLSEAVTVTARLLEPVTSNGTVSIYATPYGDPASVLVSGAVDTNGNLTKVVHLTKRTSFYATWSGDAEHPAGGISASVTVRIYPRLRAALTHFDSKAGRYRIYDYTPSCTNHGRGCPTYSATLTPSHAGQKLHFELDLYYRGRWRAVLRYKRDLPGDGKLVESFVYSNTSIVGLPTRVRSYFDGDADHLPVKAPWSYFKVV